METIEVQDMQEYIKNQTCRNGDAGRNGSCTKRLVKTKSRRLCNRFCGYHYRDVQQQQQQHNLRQFYQQCSNQRVAGNMWALLLLSVLIMLTPGTTAGTVISTELQMQSAATTVPSESFDFTTLPTLNTEVTTLETVDTTLAQTKTHAADNATILHEAVLNTHISNSNTATIDQFEQADASAVPTPSDDENNEIVAILDDNSVDDAPKETPIAASLSSDFEIPEAETLEDTIRNSVRSEIEMEQNISGATVIDVVLKGIPEVEVHERTFSIKKVNELKNKIAKPHTTVIQVDGEAATAELEQNVAAASNREARNLLDKPTPAVEDAKTDEAEKDVLNTEDLKIEQISPVIQNSENEIDGVYASEEKIEKPVEVATTQTENKTIAATLEPSTTTTTSTADESLLIVLEETSLAPVEITVEEFTEATAVTEKTIAEASESSAEPLLLSLIDIPLDIPLDNEVKLLEENSTLEKTDALFEQSDHVVIKKQGVVLSSDELTEEQNENTETPIDENENTTTTKQNNENEDEDNNTEKNPIESTTIDSVNEEITTTETFEIAETTDFTETKRPSSHITEKIETIVTIATKGSRSINAARKVSSYTDEAAAAAAFFEAYPPHVAGQTFNDNLAAESESADNALPRSNAKTDKRSTVIIAFCGGTALLFIVISVSFFLLSFHRQHGTLDIEMQEQRCGKDDLDDEDGADTCTKLLEVELPVSAALITADETEECL